MANGMAVMNQIEKKLLFCNLHKNPEFQNIKLKNIKGNKVTHKSPSRLLTIAPLNILIVLSNILRTSSFITVEEFRVASRVKAAD